MNTGLRVIGHVCESTTECTGDSKVKKQGGGELNLPYRGPGACSPRNFQPHELQSEANFN